MYSSTRKFFATAIHQTISIQRNDEGIPVVTAKNKADLCYGLGHAHASDRLVQMMQLRAMARGITSEVFMGREDLILLDRHMRWLQLGKGISGEIDKIEPDIREALAAYCEGINNVMLENARPVELLLVRYKPEPWTIADTLLCGKAMSYFGLAQVQGEMEKFIIQLIQNGVTEPRIKALFPKITEDIDYDLISKIQLRNPTIPKRFLNGIAPNLTASNNWVVSGHRTASGAAMLGSDPHMEINRLPPLWYEMVWDLDNTRMMGATLPGVPVIIFGRSPWLSWANTYGYMDMIDWYIEDCRSGRFRYDGMWKPFEQRTEVIHPKWRRPIELTFYENHHGVLDGYSGEDGYYLSMAYSGREEAGANIFNTLLNVQKIRSVEDAQQGFRKISIPTFNWVFADSVGNIGYQMCGKLPTRPEQINGLLPIPGWDPKNDWNGFVDPEQLPNCLNPDSGYFSTANCDMNAYGKANPINLHMAPYRLDRINELLAQNDKVDFDFMRMMHFDSYSRQAERLFPVFEPYIPDTENGKILKDWDYRYNADSKGATLFESVYWNVIATLFGQNGIGTDTLQHLINQTSLFIHYFGYFDDILVDKDSPWYDGLDRDKIFRQAVRNGLNGKVQSYGHEMAFRLENIFFGGKLPDLLGFSERDVHMPGGRATIPQQQKFSLFGRHAVVGQSYRMIADMGSEHLRTTLPGGPSGSRFTRWYKRDLANWITGKYKKLT